MSDEIISKENALKMLPAGDTVHTFRNGGNILLGAEWDKKDILNLFDKFEIVLAGENAKALNHRLAVNDGSWIFIETSTD